MTILREMRHSLFMIVFDMLRILCEPEDSKTLETLEKLFLDGLDIIFKIRKRI